MAERPGGRNPFHWNQGHSPKIRTKKIPSNRLSKITMFLPIAWIVGKTPISRGTKVVCLSTIGK